MSTAFWPRRDTERGVSWLSVTHVVGAPTPALAAREESMAARSPGPSNPACTKRKLNARCISSGRMNSATMSSSAPVSITAIRSPGYSSITRRNSRYTSCTGLSSPLGMIGSPVAVSGNVSSFIRASETSIRNPSAPRSIQKRRTLTNSSTTSGLRQFRSGCSEANRW